MPCFKTAASVAVSQPESKVVSAPAASTEELLKLAIDKLLMSYKENKPKKVATLCSTLHAICGKALPATQIDAVYNSLVKRGYVKLNGEQVTYDLPASS